MVKHTEYLNKWVICKRPPGIQNRFLGKIQCLYIVRETKELVYGIEGEHTISKRYTYMKSEVIREVTEEEKEKLLSLQRITKNNYTTEKKVLQGLYADAIDKIAKGERTEPFNFSEEEKKEQEMVVKPFEQKRCPYDDQLGQLINVRIGKDPMFGKSNGIMARWVCTECHNIFETTMPYLEILNLNKGTL